MLGICLIFKIAFEMYGLRLLLEGDFFGVSGRTPDRLAKGFGVLLPQINPVLV